MIGTGTRETANSYLGKIGDNAGFKDTTKGDEIELAYVTDNNVYDKDINNYNFAAITEKFNDLINGKIKEIFNSIYPVGSIYMTFNYNINPKDLFGGTWERLEDGRFLRNTTKAPQNTQDTDNTKGGNETITLSVNQLPSHTHSLPSLSHTHKFKIAHWHKPYTTGYKYALVNGVDIYFTDKRHWTTAAGAKENGFYYLGTNNTILAEDKITTPYADERGGTGKVCNGTLESPTENPDFTTNSTDPVSSGTNTKSTGNGDAINILPPYQIVYMWRRTE